MHYLMVKNNVEIFVLERIFYERNVLGIFDCYFRIICFNRNDNYIRIFYTNEAIGPDFNIFDYGITWNWNLSTV